MAGITDTVRRFIFLKATMFESMPLILTIFVPKNFETSLKYVQINLVDSTGLLVKGITVSWQKISYKVKKTRTSH